MRSLVLAASAAATLPALAQETEQVDEVLVTASRVARTGFTAPTPTAVVSEADVQRVAPLQISEALAQIPSFRTTGSPSTANVFADLRRVGPQRTLLLVDGRRHVPTQSNGTVDLNVIPAAMVERTELVTGGASASWGSDAVSGVVNIILKKNLEGFVANIQGGISRYHDDQNESASLAFGHTFGERTHLLLGAEYAHTDGIGSSHPPDLARPWGEAGNVGNTVTTNGLPGTIYAHDVRRSTLSPGGLIISAPATLRGLQFLPGAATAPFGFGQVFGNRMIGGTDNEAEYTNVGGNIKFPFQRHSLLGHVDYDLTDSTALFFEGSYSHSLTDGHTNPARNEGTSPNITPLPTCTTTTTASALGVVNVNINNAFLPTSVRNLMTAAGVSCFSMGRSYRDSGQGEFGVSDGVPAMYRAVAGAKGRFNENWSWDTYFQAGRNLYTVVRENNRNEAKFRNAIDAVIDPLTNQPACRINTDAIATNDDRACAPYNLFGFGSPSAAAVGYITGRSSLESRTWQSVGTFTVRGEPFSTWAAPVSLASGLEYRKERIRAVADPIGEANGWHTGNSKAIRGEYDVKEGFLELVVPLAKDAGWAKELDLNVAGRYTRYSTSGGVTTWKGGLSWALNDQLRLRATQSRDIRAGNLSELFTATTVQVGNARNPITNVTVQVPITTRGNSLLTPEEADTTTAGLIYQPSWLEGLRTSIDFYRIKIADQIGTLTGQGVVDRCIGDNLAEFCADVSFGSAGQITGVTVRQLNLAKFETSGFDLEAAYRLPLANLSESLPGSLNLRLIGNYVKTLETTAAINATPVDIAGQYSTPHWTVFGVLGYDIGGLSTTFDLRYYGKGTIDNAKVVGTGALDLNINDVASTFLTNATVQYDFGSRGFLESTQVYLRVNNVFDKPIPFPSQGVGSVVADELLVGRAFRVGARLRF